MGKRLIGRWRLPWLKDEDDLCSFPLGREVVEELDGVE
jgi:hypothetical protein